MCRLRPLLLLLAALVAVSGNAATTPPSRHVIIVVEENRSYSSVFPSGMGHLSAFGQVMAYTSNMFANAHGSLLDYLELTGGSMFTDAPFSCTGATCSSLITSDNIVRQLSNAGLTWKGYMECIPSAGYTGDGPYPYVKRHNPFVYYSDVVNTPSQLANVVPFTQFQADLANNALPNLSFISPGLLFDAHDGTLQNADDFLKTFIIQPLLNSRYFAPGGDGLLIVTFDEGDLTDNSGPTGAGQVLTVMIGPNVKRSCVSSTQYLLQSILRTVEEALGLSSFLGDAASASNMADCLDIQLKP